MSEWVNGQVGEGRVKEKATNTIHLGRPGSSLENGGLMRRPVRLSVGIALGLGVLLAALFLLSASSPQARAGLSSAAIEDVASQAALGTHRWLSETVDNNTNVGQYASLALAPATPYTQHISYFDGTSRALKHAWSTPSGWLSETVDSGNLGGFTSLALEPVAPYTPHISCITYVGNYIKHAWWTPSSWLSGTVDGVGVFWFTSLALESTAPYTPHISYFDDSNTSLKHAQLTPSGWLTETVDNSGDVGEYNSLARVHGSLHAAHQLL